MHKCRSTDELGNVRTFTYDAAFWPKLSSDSIGPVVSFTFNANGSMAAKAVGYDLRTTTGAATTYTYDQYGNMTGQTDALGRATLRKSGSPSSTTRCRCTRNRRWPTKRPSPLATRQVLGDAQRPLRWSG